MLYKGDQCCFMGEFVKPTGWLSNALFVETLCKRCPDPPQHCHEPLTGFTTDYHGNTVFKTALAAEYPQGLCIELAKACSAARCRTQNRQLEVDAQRRQ